MKNLRQTSITKYLIFFIIAIYCFVYQGKYSVMAQSPRNPSESKGSGLGALLFLVALGGVLLLVQQIPPSDPEFRSFKKEIKNIDNLMANGSNFIINNRKEINKSILLANNYYNKSYRAKRDVVEERKRYFDNQKLKFNNSLGLYYKNLLGPQKIKFYRSMGILNWTESHTILYNQIIPLFEEWQKIGFDFSLEEEKKEIDNMKTIYSEFENVKGFDKFLRENLPSNLTY